MEGLKMWETLPGCVLGTGDCLELLRAMPSGSVDALVTDPPAGIGFMGKAWDSDKGGRGDWMAAMLPIFAEAKRVLKPGAHGVVWALPKTSHWTATALEDAGFEIRDVVTHHFGTGFPKSKSLLKPATEHWILVRAPGPLHELEIDACRIGTTDIVTNHARSAASAVSKGIYGDSIAQETHQTEGQKAGRWPANLALSHSPNCGEFGADCAADCPIRLLDAQSGELKSGANTVKRTSAKGSAQSTSIGKESRASGTPMIFYGDTGGASRFFYCAKPSAKERDAGLPKADKRANIHPTVKSIELMTWLTKLVTPAGGVVLDPFMGSGTTGCAALQNGFRFVGIERELEYVPIARARILHWSKAA